MASDAMPGIEFLLGLRVVDPRQLCPEPAAVVNTLGMPADGRTVDNKHNYGIIRAAIRTQAVAPSPSSCSPTR